MILNITGISFWNAGSFALYRQDFEEIINVPEYSAKNTGDNVISGRMMDYDFDLLGKFIPVPAGGEIFNAENHPDRETLPPVKYGHVLIDFLDKPYPVDGFNTEGLSCNLSWLEETEYPHPEDHLEGKTYHPFNYLLSFILANCKDVNEAREVFNRVYFYEITLPLYTWRPLEHMMLHDRLGNSLVLEYIEGKPVFYESGVMTGSPTMEIHLKKLEEYKALVAADPKLDGVKGIMRVLDDDYPDERFLLLSYLNETKERANTVQKAVARCFRIMGRMEYWEEEFLVRDGSRAKNFWSIVRDHKAAKIYFRSRYNQTIQMVDVNKLLSSGRSDIYLKSGGWFKEVE